MEIDRPTLTCGEIRVRIVEQRILTKLHIIEPRDEVEEWIAWARNEDLVAWVAEETEEKAVGFTGAGREADAVERNDCSGVAVVTRDRFASGAHAKRIRLVVEHL